MAKKLLSDLSKKVKIIIDAKKIILKKFEDEKFNQVLLPNVARANLNLNLANLHFKK